MQIKWTEMARINLVETVIKVEAEKWMSNRKKWDRISALLPPQFRERTWNARRQVYNVPKCETMFSDLLHAYRCKLAGTSKRMPRVLTKSMCRVLKRYEDLRNGRPAIQTDECLRLRGVKASNCSSQHVRESSKVQTGNFDNKFETDEGICADPSNAMTIIQWTETACILLVKAVIQVEKEIQHMRIRSSSWDTRMGKWERVDSLLPPHLQGRTWNPKKGMYNPPKCASCFYNLREAYKVHLRQKGGKSSRESSRRLLLQSKPLLSLLKKHEDLLDLTATPHRTENSSKSESSDGVFASAAPCNVSAEWEEQSAGKCSASYALGSAFRDVTESKDRQGMRSSRVRAYTRANQKTSFCSSEKPSLSDYFRGSSSMERDTSMPRLRCEGSHSNLAAPLSRLDVEFTQFGKWVQDQLIPSAEKVITSSNKSGKRRKLHFGTATVPIGDPLHDSQSRRTSDKIRASFQQLRVQLAEDLKRTSVEIAEVLLQDKH